MERNRSRVGIGVTGSDTHYVTATWIDPFVAAYQMRYTLPCVVVIDQAEQSGMWEPSHCWRQDAYDKPGAMGHYQKYRDSDQIPFNAHPCPAQHAPILDFAADCLGHYLSALPQANNFPAFRVAECYNLIRYKPGQAFHGVHCDYSPAVGAGLPNRHLSGVIFLNTVEDGGELEFTQQNLFVHPEEGKAVIFPSGWTHAHHTLPPKNETRYVLQLWWSFLETDAPSGMGKNDDGLLISDEDTTPWVVLP